MDVIPSIGRHWNKKEKKQWLLCLFVGCGLVYATRTAVPLSAVALSKEFDFTKTQMGIILSSFFWGYAASQVFGGNLADRLGGDVILISSALIWSTITLMTPFLVYLFESSVGAIVPFICSRTLQGAVQGVHFPSMTSLLAKRVPESERAFSYSFAGAGVHLGLLILGYVGSLLLNHFGWTMIFHLFGGMALFWAVFMKSVMMRRNPKQHPDKIFSPNFQSAEADSTTTVNPVPWRILLATKAFWSIIIGHLSCNNAFFILLSWLPTYFNEVFPEHAEQGWMFNVVPWVISLPCTLFSGWFSDALVSKHGFSVTAARKICESLCQFGCFVFIALLGQVQSFPVALLLMGLAIASTGFHCGGILINPIDIAPSYSGAVFGLMNTAGAIPGFVGVYLAGYILDTTGSWAAVFNLTSTFCFLGGFVFLLCGTGKKII